MTVSSAHLVAPSLCLSGWGQLPWSRAGGLNCTVLFLASIIGTFW